MAQPIKKPTLNTLIDLFDEVSLYQISKRAFWTGILRSTRKRRLRDPRNPQAILPAHDTDNISPTQRNRIKDMIETVEAYMAELREKFNIK